MIGLGVFARRPKLGCWDLSLHIFLTRKINREKKRMRRGVREKVSTWDYFSRAS